MLSYLYRFWCIFALNITHTHTICAKQTKHNICLKALDLGPADVMGSEITRDNSINSHCPELNQSLGYLRKFPEWWADGVCMRLPFLPRDLRNPTSCLQDSLDKWPLNPPNRQVAPWQFRLAPAAGRSTSTVWGWATWRRHLVSRWLSEFPSWDWFKGILRNYLSIIWENTLE